jgi:hypothetical protein
VLLLVLLAVLLAAVLLAAAVPVPAAVHGSSRRARCG